MKKHKNKIYKDNNSYIINMLPGDLKRLPDESFSYVRIKNNKPYKDAYISNINNLRIVSMSPSNLKGLLDDSFFKKFFGVFYNGRYINVC